MRIVLRISALLVAAFLLTGCEGRRDIVTDLEEKEANEIIVFLAGYNIDADKMKQGGGGGFGGGDQVTMWTITVPQGQATEALAILNRNGLPRRPVKSLLNIFAKSGLVSSSQEDQIRYQEGLGRQISGVIRKIDGVLDADVQISFPATEVGLGGGTPEEAAGVVRASVYVKHTGILDDPNSQLVTKIKRLVAGSVVGLTIDNVTVVTDRARFSQVALDEGIGLGADVEYQKVWSVVVAKDSVGRFRTIFFVMCVILILVALLIVWLLFKLYPLIQHAGGLSALFASAKPLNVSKEEQGSRYERGKREVEEIEEVEEEE